MRRLLPRTGVLAIIGIAACASASPAPVRTAAVPAGNQPIRSPAAQAKADSGRPPHTAADVRFMAGMIVHHAQAVLIAGWAPTHGAGAAVQRLCERIVVGQRDEIAFMQGWLRERREAVPAGDPSHSAAHSLMPGMLSTEQLAQLDRARGTEFDRLFLTFMIQHHQGALTMVEQLLGSHGAAQDDNVWKFASDVSADQETEIDFMTLMLARLPSQKNP